MNEQEVAVCKLSEINDGEMKQVQVGTASILLARVDGECHALAAHCTHYGAPLVEGALSGNRIVCPWHHACFNASNGDIEEPPALDSLPSFPVRLDGDNIFVDVSGVSADRRTPDMAKREPEADQRVFVILGGGAAGYMAAQTLREDDYKGRILIVTQEGRTPYDRPNLSKDYLNGHSEPEWMPLRPDDFFEKYGIEIFRDKEAAGVDAQKKVIKLADGITINYDQLLIATGGIPRRLDIPGANLKNVFLLRSFDNADSIIESAASGRRAVVIGASFIGMEAAFSLRQRGLSVTVIAPDKVPFEKTLGADIGLLFQRVHESKGVEFRLDERVERIQGEGEVQAVMLGSGESIAADLVVIGVGVVPATGFLDGLDMQKDGGITVDDHLCISDGMYAAGDIASFPDPRTGERIRIEHWRTALQQGRIAAHNMAGKPTAFSSVPFFWTTQFDATLNYVGHAAKWDRIVFQGDVAKKDFLAFYVKEYRILAVAGMNRDHELAVWEELIRLNRVPSPERLSEGVATHLAL